jgi:hypothetical protein
VAMSYGPGFVKLSMVTSPHWAKTIFGANKEAKTKRATIYIFFIEIL